MDQGTRKRGRCATHSALLASCFLASFFLLPGEPAALALSRTQAPVFTLSLAGDVMLGRGVASALDGDWEAAFAGVRPWLAAADLTFANLESPLTAVPGGTGESQYDLVAPLEAVGALRVAGFDVVSLANNHALDAGEAGLVQTVAVLEQSGIAGLGDGETYRLSPVGLTFLALDDSAALLDVDLASREVAAAAQRADVVIVSIHWGGEYQAAPAPRQRAIAQALAEAGTSLIVGHGPHILQRVEWVKETLVAYSLGNFLFDQSYPVDCRWGAILHVTLQGDRIVSVEPLPTTVEGGRVRPANPQETAAILARLALDPISPPRPRLSIIKHLAPGVQSPVFGIENIQEYTP